MNTKTIITILAGLSLCFGAIAQEYPYQNPKLSPQERADDLLGRLTLEQKVSLMVNASPAIPELGIRKYNWWNEALHGAARAGLATSFPQTIGMASSWDVELLQKVFDIASTEQRIKFVEGRQKDLNPHYHGLTVWTPNINIFRDPRWGRGQETYGEDPYLTACMGEAVVKGLQGEPQGGYDKLHACLKHYAVHSGSEADRHHFNVADLPYRELRETYLYAFERIIRNTDVQEVMCAYNSFDGKPCCGNDQLLVKILREEWGYKGLVVSDCGAINDFYSPNGHQTFPGDGVSASALAVRTGTDLECGNSYRFLVDAFKQGKITEEEINTSLRRLFIARFRLGEMDPEESIPWNKYDPALLDCKEHQTVALEMAHESIVLLSNNGILPLRNKGRKYFVTGPNAKSEKYPLGNYEGKPAHVVSPYEGICTAAGESCITDNAEEADVIIYVGGINPDMEGEEMGGKPVEGFYKGDRTTIELPKAQREEIKALSDKGKKIVFVNMSGGAIALVPEAKECAAIVQAWYGGEMCGTALADVLFGQYNPSGKLPVTFYKSDSDLPEFLDYNMDNRTYRYFEGEPLWPFGFGLSYTKFKYGKAYIEGDKLVVKVRNRGKMAGDEVVQMYMHKDEDSDGPKLALRGFKRVSIPAHKSVKVEIPLSDETFATYDDSIGKMSVTPGHFTLYYGGSSDLKTLKAVKLER